MNPLPYSNSQEAPQFAPPCNETVDRHKNDTGRCSGRDPFDVMIVDHLVIPKTLAPGRYVLGLRWDCEKSAQVSVNCGSSAECLGQRRGGSGGFGGSGGSDGRFPWQPTADPFPVMRCGLRSQPSVQIWSSCADIEIAA